MTDESKTDALRRYGALNPHPQRVTDRLFRGNSFFDPRDLVQVKYEMLRQVRENDQTVTESAKCFGVSRFSWYQAQQAFDRGGLPALCKRKPGPRKRHKFTDDIIAELIREKSQSPHISTSELLTMLKERFSLNVHRRTLERVLKEVEMNQKKTPPPSQ